MARQLKLRGVQFYKNSLHTDAYISFSTYEDLIKDIRSHPMSKEQPHRKNIFSLMHDMAVVKGFMSESMKRITAEYQE